SRAARSQAILLADTAVVPVLDSGTLDGSITPAVAQRLRGMVDSALRDRHILRLRVRDIHGVVLFSDDGSGFSSQVDDEALAAVNGETTALLTTLNSDHNDSGPTGEQAVEVYAPLTQFGRRIGVLETYLPYAPIRADANSGLASLYRNLAV